MEVYTLDSGFMKEELIDDFTSVVWTERYSQAGDVELVTNPRQETINKISKGTFLAIPESKEVMLVETVEITEEKLTAKGPSILKFFEHRPLTYNTATADGGQVVWNMPPRTPGHAMALIVNRLLIDPAAEGGDPSDGLPAYMRFSNLTIESYDNSGVSESRPIPFGNIYDGLKKLAADYELGMSLFLHSASESGYALRFKTYKGVDRTSGQSTYPRIRFSHDMDSLQKIKELVSDVPYKNDTYAVATDVPDDIISKNTGSVATNFNLRVKTLIYNTGIDLSLWGYPPMTPALVEQLQAELDRRIYFERLENPSKQVNLVDGEIVDRAIYTFGVDYNLGDIVELQGFSGTVQKARITEFVRTHDDAGERGFPTVSLIAQ